MILAVFSILAEFAGVSMFEWMVTLILVYFPSFAVAVFALIVSGIFFFFMGIVTLSRLQGRLFDPAKGIPIKAGSASKKDRQAAELSNSGVTFRVLTWNHEEVVGNARVILKEVNGARSYIRTTNIEGEVTFDNIDGYVPDYYAYVEGDEKREKYRVIRKK